MTLEERVEKLEKIINILLATTRQGLIDGFLNRPEEIRHAVSFYNLALESYDKELNKLGGELVPQSKKLFFGPYEVK